MEWKPWFPTWTQDTCSGAQAALVRTAEHCPIPWALGEVHHKHRSVASCCKTELDAIKKTNSPKSSLKLTAGTEEVHTGPHIHQWCTTKKKAMCICIRSFTERFYNQILRSVTLQSKSRESSLASFPTSKWLLQTLLQLLNTHAEKEVSQIDRTLQNSHFFILYY